MADLTFLQGGNVRELLDEAGVINALAERVPSELRQAFKAAGNGADGKLAEFLDKERESLRNKLPEDAQFLITKLKDFDQQSFDLVDLTKDKSSGKAKFGVSAGATILLDALTTEQLQGDVGFAVDDDDTLLKFEVSGNLSGSAELKGTTGALSVGLNFGGGTEQSLAYYFAVPRSTYVAAALPRIGSLLFETSSLTDVVEAMETHGLLRVERRSDSTMNLGLTIGISQGISTMIGGLSATGGIGGSLKVEYLDAATFSLIVDRAAGDRYIIDFRKTRRKERSSVLKLGVDVRIAGFREKLIDKIALAIPEDKNLQGLLKQLDSLTQELSEEVLGKKLAEALESEWPQGKTAIAVLLGEETVDDLAEEIQGELLEKIEDVINAKLDLLNTQADAAASIVATEIADALGLEGSHRHGLEAYVGGAVEKAFSGLGSSIDDAVEKLVKQGSTALADLLRPWEKIAGDAVSDAVKALSKNSQNAAARARVGLAKVHERYTRFRQGVLTAVKEKVEEELSVSFIAEKERTVTHTRSVRYEFRRADKGAADLYKALWTGDLLNLRSLLSALEPANTISLAGEYILTEANVAKRALAVNFFGLKVAAETLFSSTVEVGIDLNGRLIVATSKGDLEERRQRGGESQVVKATWCTDYLRSNLLEAPLLIKVVLTDKEFESGDEVEDFFGPLERLEAMRPGVSGDVETKLFTSSVKSIKNATLTVNVMLRWEEWLELVGVDLTAQPVAGAWQADAVCREFLGSAETLARPYVTASREVMQRTDFKELLPFLLAFGGKKMRKKAAEFVGEPSKRQSDEFGTSWRLARSLASLNDGLVALQANWKTLVTKLLAAPPLTDADLEKLRSEIDAVNIAFANAFEGVLSTGLLFDDVGRLHWLTAATLNLFKSRSNLPNPFLSCTFQSEQTGQLLFS